MSCPTHPRHPPSQRFLPIVRVPDVTCCTPIGLVTSSFRFKVILHQISLSSSLESLLQLETSSCHVRSAAYQQTNPQTQFDPTIYSLHDTYSTPSRIKLTPRPMMREVTRRGCGHSERSLFSTTKGSISMATNLKEPSYSGYRYKSEIALDDTTSASCAKPSAGSEGPVTSSLFCKGSLTWKNLSLSLSCMEAGKILQVSLLVGN